MHLQFVLNLMTVSTIVFLFYWLISISLFVLLSKQQIIIYYNPLGDKSIFLSLSNDLNIMSYFKPASTYGR
jgi:hypothetical protein